MIFVVSKNSIIAVTWIATFVRFMLEARLDVAVIIVFISRCYVVAMFNMQHNALNLIFCTGPEG